MKKIAVIYSNYYQEITSSLIDVFKQTLGETEFEFMEFEVFGVSEIPYKLSSLNLADFAGAAVFGCVLEGETYHHELINNFVFNSLYDISIKNKLPLGYGILNVKTMQQARERAMPQKDTNRGFEAAMALKSLI
jgi:6,7-dimethyl-8-ribityllumazine synthase